MLTSKFFAIIFFAVFLINSKQEETNDDDNQVRRQKGPSKKEYVGSDPKQYEGIVGSYQDNKRLVSLANKNEDGTNERVIEADHLVQTANIDKAKDELKQEIKDIEDKNEGKEMSKRNRKLLKRKRKNLKKLENMSNSAITIMVLFKDHSKTGSFAAPADRKLVNFAKQGKTEKLVGEAVKDYKKQFGDRFDESLRRAVAKSVQKGEITIKQGNNILKANKLSTSPVKTEKGEGDFQLDGHETRRQAQTKLRKFIKKNEGRGDLISKAIQTSNDHMGNIANPKRKKL